MIFIRRCDKISPEITQKGKVARPCESIMRKAVIILLCLATVLCLFGCGKNADEKTPEKANPSTTAAPEVENYSVVDTKDLIINEETATGEKVTQSNGSYHVFYKEDDLVKTVFEYGSDGKISRYSQYERNKDQKTAAVINYDRNRKYISATKYEYNPDGTVYRIYYYDAEGNMDYYEQDSYEGGVRTGALYDADGTLLADPYATTKAAGTTAKAETTTAKPAATTAKAAN